MKRIPLILAFLFVSFVSVSAQNVEGKEIINREIEWSDFLGEADPSSEFDAVTNWVITYAYPQPTFKNETARVKVQVSLFLRSDSWVRANKQTQRLLNHERGHFKIGKICAKEIQETINSMIFDRYDYAKQINVVYRKIIEKYKEFEKQYDNETDHYKNRPQQELWDKKLNDLLEL